MVQQLVYPSAARLTTIEQDLIPVMIQDDPLFDIMPIETEDDDILRWEQRDNYKGLQQVRGINNDPPRVARIGQKGYIAEPGYYGEFGLVDEREITKRRKLGSFGEPIDISEPVAEIQEQLLIRRLDRIRQIGWLLLTTGTFAIVNAQGVLQHTDTYTMQSYTATVPWSTLATATPLKDLRAVKLLSRGHSIAFDSRSFLYVNAVTANNFLMNLNPNDLFGRRGNAGATFNSLADFNQILVANDLPQIRIYDEGYINDAGSFTLFIPDGVGILVGRRTTGAPIGAYRMTRNAQNPNAAPGPYTRVVDDPNDIPRKIAVHDGHNGGPVLYFPSAIVRMAI